MTRLRKEDYSIGWICALPETEMKASRILLDDEHEDPQLGRETVNQYVFGEMVGHNIVMACLPEMTGEASAASVAAEMMSIFSLRCGLLVGVGGGVPSRRNDIRLGDVVVSRPTEEIGGVVHFDAGRIERDGRLIRASCLNSPPTVLRSALAKTRSTLSAKSRFRDFLEALGKHVDGWEFSEAPLSGDRLFEASYDHDKDALDCDECDTAREQPRGPRQGNGPRIHYGTIASGKSDIRDAGTRDRLSKELKGVLCFEREAAGLMNTFPCLVIRGICDYCDSHKNDDWQKFAAASAVAWAKWLLCNINPRELHRHEESEKLVQGENIRASPADDMPSRTIEIDKSSLAYLPVDRRLLRDQ